MDGLGLEIWRLRLGDLETWRLGGPGHISGSGVGVAVDKDNRQ